jgi:phosphatidate cytidylyltransferase
MKPGTGDVEDISGKHSSELFVRIRTGAVLAVMGFIVLCLSHIHYVLNTVAASLSILGIYELLHAVRADTFPRMLILSLLSIIICFFEISRTSLSARPSPSDTTADSARRI